ncbi:C-type lectin fold [Trinorchestia longiramus]|nr:C-type lectin fold [Trinorchestia longiramus]
MEIFTRWLMFFPFVSHITDALVVEHGTFLTVQGLTFNKVLAYATDRVTKKCRCTDKCALDSDCSMYGGYFAQDSYYCSRYGKTPFDFKVPPLTDPGAFISIKAQKLGMVNEASDGYVYWLAPNRSTIEEAREMCNKLSGFRLGIYKLDQQVSILDKYYKISGATDSILMGLTKDADSGDPVWDDGSKFVASGAYKDLIVDDGGPASTVYAYGLNDKINDVPGTYEGWPLCQGRPFYIPIQ